MNIKSYPAKSEKIRWIERIEGVIALNPATGKYSKLNETASYVWQISNGINSIEEIYRKIAKKYCIKENKAKKDILGVLENFKKAGIMEFYEK